MFPSVSHKLGEITTNEKGKRMIQYVVPLHFVLFTRCLEVGRTILNLFLGLMLPKGYYYTAVHLGNGNQDISDLKS